jgi:rubrerythrin
MDKKEFERIMEQAIEAEVESYEFYRDVANKATNPAVKQLFIEFAREEHGHKEQLEEIKAKGMQDFDFAGAADYKVSETVDLPPLSAEMKPTDAIALAMKKEEAAVKIYSHLASSVSDPAIQKIYTELAQMETEHKARMEDLYTNMAFGEVW